MIDEVATAIATGANWMVTFKLFLVGLAAGAIVGSIGIYYLIKH